MPWTDEQARLLIATCKRLVNLDGVVSFGELRAMRALRTELGEARWSDLVEAAATLASEDALEAAWAALDEAERAALGERLGAVAEEGGEDDGGEELLARLGVALPEPEPEPLPAVSPTLEPLARRITQGELPDTNRVRWIPPTRWGEDPHPAVAALTLSRQGPDADERSARAVDAERLQIELIPGRWALHAAPRALDDFARRFNDAGLRKGALRALYLGRWPTLRALAEVLSRSPWLLDTQPLRGAPYVFTTRFTRSRIHLVAALDLRDAAGLPVTALIEGDGDPWSKQAIEAHNAEAEVPLPRELPLDALAALPPERVQTGRSMSDALESMALAPEQHAAALEYVWALGLLRKPSAPTQGLLTFAFDEDPALRCAAHALLLRRAPDHAEVIFVDEDHPAALAVMTAQRA